MEGARDAASGDTTDEDASREWRSLADMSSEGWRAWLGEGGRSDGCLKNGETVLFRLCQEGQEAAVTLLLEHGASADARNQPGTNGGATPLHACAALGRKSLAELLLKHGASPNQRDDLGRTPIFVARDDQVLRLLLESGGNPRIAARDSGNTPLHSAAFHGQLHCAQLLFIFGADANAKSKNGFTCLHVAAHSGHIRLVELCLAKGASINAASKNGLLPWQCATDPAIVELLRTNTVRELASAPVFGVAVPRPQAQRKRVARSRIISTPPSQGVRNRTQQPPGSPNERKF
jgi:ankyrin repeat protein